MAEQEKNNPAVKKQAEKPAKVKKPSLFARIKKWFRELKGCCAVLGVFIWILDAIFGIGFQTLVGFFGA